ncbi:MFS transporter [Alphaproteobacteria bacterium LSUCC0684]
MRDSDIRPAAAMSRKTMLAYAFYDWASSPVPTLHATFVFAVYFSTAVMPDGGTTAWAWMTAFSALVVAVISPVLGAAADRMGQRKALLLLASIIGGGATACLWFVLPEPGYASLALMLSGVSIISMETAFVFYNALLPGVAGREMIGRVSGFSWGAGYIGAIVCLLLVLGVFILPETPGFGLETEMAEHVRITMPLSAIWFGVFAIPFFLLVPEGPRSGQRFIPVLRDGWSIVRNTPGLLRFLIARMFYADALVTLFAFGGIFAAKVFGFSQTEVIGFAIVLNITAGLGAVLGGMVDDRLGSLATIRICLVALIGLGLTGLMAPNATLFWIAGSLFGIFIGPLQAASRSHALRLSPIGAEARVFGFMMLTGKATAFVGPLVYGWLVLQTGNERAGMATVIALLVLGIWLLPFRSHQA